MVVFISHLAVSGLVIASFSFASHALADQELGAYKFSCTKSNPCDSTKNFTCDTSISRCVCAQHPDPGYMLIFDVHISACVPILVEHKHEFWRCEDEFYTWNTTKPDNSSVADLGFCKSHHECHVAHDSKSLRCNLSTCSCECLTEHPETGLKLISLPKPIAHAPATACIYKPIKCQTHSVCEQEYGNHSECNMHDAACKCKPKSRFFHGQCVRERRLGECCHYDLECGFGMGQNSRCGGSGPRPKCECMAGFQHDAGTGQCAASAVLAKPKLQSVDDHDHNCLTAPMIIMLIVCIILVTGFVTVSVCWFRQGKSYKKCKSYFSLKRMKTGGRRNRGIEMTPNPSFLSSKDLDEGTDF